MPWNASITARWPSRYWRIKCSLSFVSMYPPSTSVAVLASDYDRTRMLARILDIPPPQEAPWGAGLAVVRCRHGDAMKLRGRAERPREGDPFSFVEVDVPGD